MGRKLCTHFPSPSGKNIITNLNLLGLVTNILVFYKLTFTAICMLYVDWCRELKEQGGLHILMLSESHQKFGIYKSKNCLASTIFIILLYFSSAFRVTKGRRGKGNCQQEKEGWAHNFLLIVPLQSQPLPAFIKAVSLLAVMGILRDFCISSKPLEFPKMDNTLKSGHCYILDCFVC